MNLQADIARDLIQAGVAVHAFNQRSVEDILAMIETVRRLVGAEGKTMALVADLEKIIGPWYSRKFGPEKVAARPG